MRLLSLLSTAVLLLAVACGSDSSQDSSDPEIRSEPNERCESACAAIQAACASTEADCATDCTDDLNACPVEMGLVLDCVLASQLQCDPEQDQGLAREPCASEHTMVENCGNDPF